MGLAVCYWGFDSLDSQSDGECILAKLTPSAFTLSPFSLTGKVKEDNHAFRHFWILESARELSSSDFLCSRRKESVLIFCAMRIIIIILTFPSPFSKSSSYLRIVIQREMKRWMTTYVYEHPDRLDDYHNKARGDKNGPEMLTHSVYVVTLIWKKKISFHILLKSNSLIRTVLSSWFHAFLLPGDDEEVRTLRLLQWNEPKLGCAYGN